MCDCAPGDQQREGALGQVHPSEVNRTRREMAHLDAQSADRAFTVCRRDGAGQLGIVVQQRPLALSHLRRSQRFGRPAACAWRTICTSYRELGGRVGGSGRLGTRLNDCCRGAAVARERM